MLHNEEVRSNTIYSSSEASGVNHIFTNCENNSKNCENNIIFTENCEVIQQKAQNNTFYLTGITPSRGN